MSTFAQADGRRRITLPPGSGIKPGDPMEVDLLEDGRVVITPIFAVPKHQIWAWNPEVMEKVTKALTDPRSRTKLTSSKDLQALALELGIDPQSI